MFPLLQSNFRVSPFLAQINVLTLSIRMAIVNFMDERFVLNGISFVWDASKARMNLTKHQVSFEQAAEVFFDPFFRVIDASPDTESRDAVIGMDTAWNLLYVVHVVMEDDRIRIISARPATRGERQLYEN